MLSRFQIHNSKYSACFTGKHIFPTDHKLLDSQDHNLTPLASSVQTTCHRTWWRLEGQKTEYLEESIHHSTPMYTHPVPALWRSSGTLKSEMQFPHLYIPLWPPCLLGRSNKIMHVKLLCNPRTAND